MTLVDEYFDYILDIIDFNLPKHRKYGRLIEVLYETEFFWVVPMDENREIDALSLRKEFLFDTGKSVSDIWNDSVSVLEVLVAFSKRIETEITGEPGEDDLGKWFWIMIDNLGLLNFPDNKFDETKISKILDNWMERKFKKSGNGSIFLTHKTDIDFRNMEMWYQMQQYLDENWSF